MKSRYKSSFRFLPKLPQPKYAYAFIEGHFKIYSYTEIVRSEFSGKRFFSPTICGS